jgi:hypothetical protein
MKCHLFYPQEGVGVLHDIPVTEVTFAEASFFVYYKDDFPVANWTLQLVIQGLLPGSERMVGDLTRVHTADDQTAEVLLVLNVPVALNKKDGKLEK